MCALYQPFKPHGQTAHHMGSTRAGSAARRTRLPLRAQVSASQLSSNPVSLHLGSLGPYLLVDFIGENEGITKNRGATSRVAKVTAA